PVPVLTSFSPVLTEPVPVRFWFKTEPWPPLLGAEEGFIDTQKLKSYIEHAFQLILKAASKIQQKN
ncbi:hypothetical protein P3X46_012246, partial [Hevea brasiliensis]